MSGLGDILELLHGAAERARPDRLTVVEWTHGPRSEVGFDRFIGERHQRIAPRRPREGARPGADEAPRLSP